MKNEESNIIVRSEGNEEVAPPDIVVSLNSKDVIDFILKVFGKNERITRTVSGSFRFERDVIKDFRDLIVQRVEEQHESRLVSELVEVSYAEERSLRFNSIKEFLSYNEVGRFFTKEINIELIFLIKFPKSNLPRKQAINLRVRGVEFQENDPIPGGTGFIELSIDYTERTWGLDIESICTNFFNRKRKAVIDGILNEYWDKIVKYLSKAGFVSQLLMLIGALYVFTTYFDPTIESIDNEDILRSIYVVRDQTILIAIFVAVYLFSIVYLNEMGAYYYHGKPRQKMVVLLFTESDYEVYNRYLETASKPGVIKNLVTKFLFPIIVGASGSALFWGILALFS